MQNIKKDNTFTLLMTIRDRIKAINQNIYEDPIPTSDFIFRKHLMDLVYNEDTAQYYLKLLSESNFIFIIHIVEADPILKIPGIYGYVVAEKDIIEHLLAVYKKKLESVYEIEKRKAAGADTIIRELIPKVKEFNNTPLGKFLNICIMLDQFLRIYQEKPDHYNDEYRIYILKKYLPEEEVQNTVNEEVIEIKETKKEKKFQRAVDTEEYKELSKMNLSGNWGKAIEKFGVQFLIRVHLRNNEYDILKKLLLQKKIAKEEDLLFLRDTLRKMEERSLFEKELKKYQNEIKELKRIAQIKLNQFYLIRKKYEGK